VTVLVLDSGGVSRLARQSQDAAALIAVFTRDGIWPPVVPSIVLVECLSGRQRTDALVNRFLKTCDIVDTLSEHVARRARALRTHAGRGSAVDAVVVAMAEPGGSVLTGDVDDLRALAALADDVVVHRA
jgi:predicted nucleic acid-binding protein